MTFEEFEATSTSESPPAGLSGPLLSLWYDRNGDWEMAHHIIQDLDSNQAAWIHAYLHRKEGDLGNADHWYRMAGIQRPSISLQAEWKQIALAVLLYV